MCKKQVVSVHKASLICCILHRQGTYNRMYYYLLQPCMHAASGDITFNIGISVISVVGVIIIMVCSLNMVIAGGIKFRSYRTTNKMFRLKKNRK